MGSGLDIAVAEVFRTNSARTSIFRGTWDITDLMTWIWILTAKSAERAILRLLSVTSKGFEKQDGAKIIPTAVFLFLLRRQNIPARLVPPLLSFAWRLMQSCEREFTPSSISDGKTQNLHRKSIVYPPPDDAIGMRTSEFAVVIFRLLKIANETLPSAYESIVALCCHYLDGTNFQRLTPTFKLESLKIARLTYIYNSILRTLAVPAKAHPFQSTRFQQRAQFRVLRRMKDFDSPLIIDRSGYQGVVSVQLRHTKTLQEREWARMKAKSWPPWKEEKLGLDASIDVDHGISRAKIALTQAREAGYAADEWDEAAEILSGWDSDGSPTIQKRAYIRGKPIGFGRRMPRVTDNGPEGSVIWAARIQATRTLDEAWACFLTYKDQSRDLSQEVCYEMFEKIVFDEKRRRNQENGHRSQHGEPRRPLPGDGKEVLPRPESPKDSIYVRSAPPSYKAFLKHMADNGIKLSGKFLAQALSNANTFLGGFQVLQASSCTLQEISIMFNPPCENVSGARHPWLEDVPDYIISAFIHYLTNFAPIANDRNADLDQRIPTGTVIWNERLWQVVTNTALANATTKAQSPNFTKKRRINPLHRALHLLFHVRPRHRRPWYHVLSALARPMAVIGMVSTIRNMKAEDIRTWTRITELLDQMHEINMHVDLDGFLLVCSGLEKAIFAAEKLRNLPQTPHHLHEVAGGVLVDGLPLVKDMFYGIVGSKKAYGDFSVQLRSRESQVENFNEKDGASAASPSSKRSYNIMAPELFIPTLPTIPHPAHFHAFIRILGLRRDYQGLKEFMEWMSLYSVEIHTIVEEAMNGPRMLRRCLTATRVFLEGSWIECETNGSGIAANLQPAPVEVVQAVEEIVERNKDWGGWPTEEEVDDYCQHGQFI
ncbi:hypothetical protein MMC21_005740 [Puttea exsequens]|nr:hypothetical protein [Puttea exsequens]